MIRGTSTLSNRVIEGGVANAVPLDLRLVERTCFRSDKDEVIVIGVDSKFAIGGKSYRSCSLSFFQGENINDISQIVTEDDLICI